MLYFFLFSLRGYRFESKLLLFWKITTLSLNRRLIKFKALAQKYGSNYKKKKTVEGITKVFEDMGVPKDAVRIVIYKDPKEQ